MSSMGIGLKYFALAVCVSLVLLFTGGLSYSHASPRMSKVTLTVPHAPAINESLRAEVTVGALPRGANIVVRTMDGEIAGTVSPFGAMARQNTGFYMIPLPSKFRHDKTISLILQLEDEHGVRAPNNKELLGVRLVYIPVTPFESSPF